MILEISNICKTYSKSDFALRDISFAVPHGSIMGMVGENGSGKTTTLNIILGLMRANSGTVNIFGNPFSTDDIEAKAQMAVVFDGNCFPDPFTPRHISKIFSKIYKRWDNALFLDLLKTYEISEKQTVSNMSQGTKAMMAIITALSQRPKLLILDEPTAGVDPVRREEVLDLFLDFVSDGQKSILFSSHITSDLERIADYITFIHKGKLIDSAEKDVFLYKYGIIRCGQEAFDAMQDKTQIIRYVKRDYQYRILVKDQSKIQGDFVLESPTLDEVMYIISRGQTL